MTPVPDRLAGQPRRRRDDRIAPEANRDRFGGGPQPPRPLIEQRPHHHILGDERRFEIDIAPHRTRVRSRFLCSWQANSRVRPKDTDGRPIVIGRRLQVVTDKAAIIRRIFDWAADGVGSATILDRLNREGVPATRGKRWNKSPVDWLLKIEQYVGRQIWGQRGVERDPSNGREFQRRRPRSEWKIVNRPELRIISDEVWERVEATKRLSARRSRRKTPWLVAERKAPLQAPVLWLRQVRGLWRRHVQRERGRAAPGSDVGVRGRKAQAPAQWADDSCARFRSPQILAKLQGELLKPATLTYITQRLEKEVQKALASGPKNSADAGSAWSRKSARSRIS